jgi:hypothetical protein
MSARALRSPGPLVATCKAPLWKSTGLRFGFSERCVLSRACENRVACVNFPPLQTGFCFLVVLIQAA